jgi:ADP-ribose pyrophosphatase YjhB (NUDIX family)
MDKWYNLCMLQKLNESLVLLTYKEKILLTIRNYVINSGAQRTWSLIGGEKKNDESLEKTIIRRIKEEMKIEIDGIKFLLVNSSENKDTYFYHGKLTDNNVNLIERSEGQELQFFDLKELNKIHLANSADLFFTLNRDIVEELLVN